MNAHSNLADIVVASKDAIWCDLKGEAVILHMSSGVYFGLQGVSLAIWQFIQNPRSLSDVIAHLTSTFDVATEVCAAKTSAFVDELAQHGLVLIANAEGA